MPDPDRKQARPGPVRTTPTEAERKERVARIDPGRWVAEYGDYLFRYALRRLKDREQAEDVVQETLLAAVRGHKTYSGLSAERTWLVGILKHKIVDHIRRRSRELYVEDVDRLDDASEQFFDTSGRWRVGPVKWRSNPASYFEQEEFWRVFSACLEGIPPRLATAFKLRELDGLSGEEICKLLEITSTNYWVMLYRARMRLRSCLEANWIEKEGA